MLLPIHVFMVQTFLHLYDIIAVICVSVIQDLGTWNLKSKVGPAIAMVTDYSCMLNVH